MWILLFLNLFTADSLAYDNAVSVSRSAVGTTFVLDAGKSLILKLDATNRIESQAGGRGSRMGAYRTPSDLDASHELTIYIADPGSRRIVMLDRHLQHVSDITSSEHRYDRIAVNRFRELFAVDSEAATIHKFRPNGELDHSFSPPSFDRGGFSDVAVSGDNVLLGQANILWILSRFGLENGFRRFDAPITRITGTPEGALVLAGGKVYVLDGRFTIVAELEVPKTTVDVASDGVRMWLLSPHTLIEKTLP